MSALIGSTGFVGGHLQKSFEFSDKFNRANISEIHGLETDLLICAGLPAEKWIANSQPETDWLNMMTLAQTLTSVKALTAVLISTVDVYQHPFNVTEENSPTMNGIEAYGRNRAWFEVFFRANFGNSHIIRLPGLFSENLKKNFIYDLVNSRKDQLERVNGDSTYQFFNMTKIHNVVSTCIKESIPILNVATEPLTAQEIADNFKVELNKSGKKVNYDMKSLNAEVFNGKNGYLYSKDEILHGIRKLSV